MTERRDTRRRFEQWARNPACAANAVSAVYGIPMTEVAKSEGLQPSMGQSPFAIARGQGFERSLFEKDAERLRKALAYAEVIESTDADFIDLRLRLHGGRKSTLDEALDATKSLLARTADPERAPSTPTIVAGATIHIPGGPMLPEAILVLDVLLIRGGDVPPSLMVGEIKTYPDRGGYTDAAELATARAQMGVYLHGLEVILQEHAIRERLRLCRTGFLVLTRPGFNLPIIRAREDLQYQLERARRGFDRLREVASAYSTKGDGVQAVLDAPYAYDESCLSFCDRAPGCYKRALGAGDPVVLGLDVARFLGEVDLGRASAVLAGEPPRNEAEREISRQLREVKDLMGPQ